MTTYTGGIGTHYASLLPAIVRLGIEVELVLFAEPTESAKAGAEVLGSVDGVTLVARYGLSRLPEPVRLIVRALILRRHVRAGYTHVIAPEWGGIAALLPKTTRLVTNLATGIGLGDWIASRNWLAYPRKRRAARLLQDRLESRQIIRSSGLIAISRSVLDWNRTHLASLPEAIIVPNCVEVDVIRAAVADVPRGTPDDAPVILFVGRLERRKGILPTMSAFASILESWPTARLQLAGSTGDSRFEPASNELLDLVPPAHRSQVEFLGHLPSRDVYRRAALATVAVCPSLWEGFGNVALEMKAVGVPLIVTGGSGFDDFCSDGVDCLMAKPGDADSLAEALREILRSPQLAERLAHAGADSVTRYSPDVVAAEFVAAVRSFSSSER